MTTKKGINRESFVQKFPDSERGEMKSRASFLGGDLEDDIEDSNIRTFRSLQQLTQSPTKGDKTPFSRTPRATLDGDLEETEESGRELSSPRGVKEKQQKEGKTNIFGKILSKHRNKR